MKTKYLLAIIIVLGYLLISIHKAQGAVNPNDCQYPVRPLVNGTCDNSDPAIPENIKDEVRVPEAQAVTPVEPISDQGGWGK